MPYNKTTWIDRLVQFPRRFGKTLENSETVTLTPDPGAITEAGTMVSAVVMNNLEKGVEDAHNLLALVNSVYSATGVNAYAITGDPSVTALYDGLIAVVKIPADNTLAACTLNYNGLGAKNILISSASPLAPGDLKVSFIYTFRYSSALSGWVIQGGSSAPLSYDGQATEKIINVGPGQTFTTVQSALDSLKKVNAGPRTLVLTTGATFAEVPSVKGFHGGLITIRANSGDAAIAGLDVLECTASLFIQRLRINQPSGKFNIQNNGNSVTLIQCTKTVGNASSDVAVWIAGGFLTILLCTFSVQGTGINAFGGSIVNLQSVTGTGNLNAVDVDNAIMTKDPGSNISGTVVKRNGGQFFI